MRHSTLMRKLRKLEADALFASQVAIEWSSLTWFTNQRDRTLITNSEGEVTGEEYGVSTLYVAQMGDRWFLASFDLQYRFKEYASSEECREALAQLAETTFSDADWLTSERLLGA
jgi:hypothetical protein